MPVIPIREDNAYIGAAKQSSQGTPVAPTNFFRWLDGTKLSYDLKTSQVWEGDGSRRLSQDIKNMQFVKIDLEFNPRPIELGFIEAASMGIGSDSVTAPSVSTTVSATTVAGASSITVASNAGLTASGSITLVLSPGTVNEEIATFSIPATGAGPYTLTVANSGTLKNPHTSTDAVRAYALHTITDQYDVPYYTFEVCLGALNGGNGVTIRVTDCKIDTINRSSKAGELLMYKVGVVGIASVVQGSPSTVVLENHNPFLYVQTNGNWTLNGSTSGDAIAVESFEIDQKNNVGTPQAEQLTPAALLAGNIDVSVKASLIYQNPNILGMTYWGGVSGTTDAQSIGAGNMIVSFVQADGFHKVTYTLNTMHYTKTTEPTPKNKAKWYTLGIQTDSVSNQGLNAFVLQVAVQNGQTSSY